MCTPGEGPPNAPRVMEGGGNTEGILIFFFPLTPAYSTVNSTLLRSGTKIAFLIKEQCIDITNYSFAFSKAPYPNPLLSPQGKRLAPWVAASRQNFYPGSLASCISCKYRASLHWGSIFTVTVAAPHPSISYPPPPFTLPHACFPLSLV